MRITLVAAMTRNRVIGRDGDMPWHLPADLAHFKQVTMGRPVVMGRRTRESLGRALPGRRNIVISRSRETDYPDAEVVASLQTALERCAGEEEVMILGGGQIYQEALPRADRIELTRIETELEGDTHFPEIDTGSWREVASRHRPADEKNAWPMTFLRLERDQSETSTAS